MISIPRRSAAVVAASALLLSPLVGCGDEEQSSPASSATSSATESSAASESPKAVGTEINAADFAKKVAGAMKDQASAHMSIVGSSAFSFEADAVYGANPATRMDITLMGQKSTIVIVDGTLYLKQGAGKFAKVDKDDPTFGSMLGSYENFGPRASVDALGDAITRVGKVGTQKIDGVELTQYAVTVDTSRAAGPFSQLGATSQFLDMKFFLDANDLVRQIEVDASGEKVAIKFTDWGKPVRITAPSGADLAASPDA